MNKCIIISASGRRKSNSRSIAEFLSQRMIHHGADCSVTDMADPDVVDLAAEAQQVILIAPLYHDTLSYHATRLLEELAGRNIRDKALGAIVHSGYPEPVQRSCAIDICHCFADYQGWAWLGSLSPGLTSVIDRKPLEETGGMFKVLRKSCVGAAAFWAEGKPIDQRLYTASAKVPIPSRLLGMVANWSMRRDARKQGKDILRKPYGEYKV